MNITSISYSQKDINQKRDRVLDGLKNLSHNIKTDVIEKISSWDLELLFRLYDQVFFDNWFGDTYRGKLKFSLSRRMTKSAGISLCPKNIASIKPEDLILEIRIGIDFFFNYDITEGDNLVCGLKTKTATRALQLVFEHELCHLIEFIVYQNSSCRNERFKLMAKNLFGHKESHHSLPNQRAIINQKYNFQIGDRVSFILKGKETVGIVYNITKRATVMVRDKNGIMVDKKGNRYAKYYVPLALLQIKK